MTQPASIVNRGFRCECWTQNPATGGTRTLIDSIDVETAAQAIRYISIAIRTIAPALKPEAVNEAWDWLSDDNRNALQALNSGKPHTVTIHDSRTTIQWTARPVDFLQLATRQGINLPACAEQYTEPQHQTE